MSKPLGRAPARCSAVYAPPSAAPASPRGTSRRRRACRRSGAARTRAAARAVERHAREEYGSTTRRRSAAASSEAGRSIRPGHSRSRPAARRSTRSPTAAAAEAVVPNCRHMSLPSRTPCDARWRARAPMRRQRRPPGPVPVAPDHHASNSTDSGQANQYNVTTHVTLPRGQIRTSGAISDRPAPAPRGSPNPHARSARPTSSPASSRRCAAKRA